MNKKVSKAMLRGVLKRYFGVLKLKKNNADENQLTPTRSKRQLNFCKTSTNLAKKSLNQSLKLSRKRRLSLSKKPQSSSSSSSSHQCKSPSSISSFSSLSSCRNKYLTNNTNNGNQSSSTAGCKTTTQTLDSDKAQKENIKVNSKTKNNKMVKRLAARGRAKSKKSDTDNANQEDSEYESDDEKSAESDNGAPNEQKTFQIKNEAKEDQLERNSNETESIKNLDEEENEPSNQNEEERPAPRSKRIKQEVDYSDDIRKKSTRITRNHNLTETVTKISKSAHDEPLYCTCREISYGQMIMCDNDACQIEWFHFNCVKLTSKPKGKWYCPLCRGDTHKVMKKSHLMQSSASSSLSSPSYYASNYSNRCK
ncbi:inhibitor of growth 1 [Brachionus plicatilis]|uniref:Inhibitor of growth 1 n=1 Tax=Brachionus plicatilis TaxID=10195 RepID=A0A3M7SWY4_BRAPC|nr:inhibitor of growth 1 [Brachionus plicatilis]